MTTFLKISSYVKLSIDGTDMKRKYEADGEQLICYRLQICYYDEGRKIVTCEAKIWAFKSENICKWIGVILAKYQKIK